MRSFEFVNRRGEVRPCAWCQREQGVPPANGETHGICPRHTREVLAQVGMGLQRDAAGVARPALAARRNQNASPGGGTTPRVFFHGRFD